MSDAEHKKKDSKVGLYSTLIFHLSIVIILLLASIGGMMSPENTFVIDFTKQEELEKEMQVEEMKQKVSDEVDNLIAMAKASASGQQVRNVAVNANERLRDDRNANPSRVYEDARELQRKLDAAAERSKQLDAADAENYADPNNTPEKKTDKDTPAYSGPSVLSYDLEGRVASSLKVPAYRAYGAGDVSVKIYVNRKGNVIRAEVIEGVSASDPSMRDFAVNAAKKSKFNASSTAQDPQIGSIVYRFVRQ